MVTFVFLVSDRLLHHQNQLFLFYFGSKDQTLDLTCYAGVLPVSPAALLMIHQPVQPHRSRSSQVASNRNALSELGMVA